jgi:GTP pyrophosphokinase
VIDRVGVFKDILSRLSDQNINVRNAQVELKKEDQPSSICASTFAIINN